MARHVVVFTQTENVLSTGIERTCFIRIRTVITICCTILKWVKVLMSQQQLTGHKESENEATWQLTLSL